MSTLYNHSIKYLAIAVVGIILFSGCNNREHVYYNPGSSVNNLTEFKERLKHQAKTIKTNIANWRLFRKQDYPAVTPQVKNDLKKQEEAEELLADIEQTLYRYEVGDYEHVDKEAKIVEDLENRYKNLGFEEVAENN